MLDQRTATAETDRPTLRRLPGPYGIETLEARYLLQTFKPHAHEEYLIGVIHGGVHAVWCRGDMNAVPAGSVVTMRPGDVHHGGAGGEHGWRQRMIYIPEAGMHALLSDIQDRDFKGTLNFEAAFHARPDLARQLAALLRILHESVQMMERDVALDRLMDLVVTNLTGQVNPPRYQPDGRIADAMAYLDAHVGENVALEELCLVTGLRRRQTIAAFRRATGLPPHAWHLQRKIARVKTLLSRGMPPADAAAETGFADQSHMGRHFAAIVGITPAAYARG